MTETTAANRGPFLLRTLWWLFSPRYRKFGTPERAQASIAKVAEREGVSDAQAFALIYSEMPEHWRPMIANRRPGHP